jgi:hypothetical protein
VVVLALLAVWAGVSLWLSGRLLRGLHCVWRLRKAADKPEDARLLAAVREAFAAIDQQPCAIYESPRLHAPVALGWMRPAIIMPSGLAKSLDDEQLACVLAHEAAHVARRDTLVALVQQLAAALFWWNGLVHVVNRRIDRLREWLCDEQVISQRGHGMPLAQAIVHVAAWSQSRRHTMPLAAALVENSRHLEDRIIRLTAEDPPMSPRMNTSSLTLLTGFTLCLGGMLLVPTLRAQFDEARPQESGPRESARPEAGAQTVSVQVSGRATDQNGQPIAGARVYLVSTNSIDKQLGSTATDVKGRYQFQDVELPLRDFQQGQPLQGTLQVFGDADGFGIAWHGMRHVLTGPRPPGQVPDKHSHAYYESEPIEMNLTFRQAASLRGQVTDDQDRPVSNVEIHLSTLDYLEMETHEIHPNFREFWAFHLAPEKYRLARTDADGRFEISGLPLDTTSYVHISHADYAEQTFIAAITDKSISAQRYIANSSVTVKNGETVRSPIWETRNVRTSPLAIRLRAAQRVLVTVLNSDQLPAKDVRLVARSENAGTEVHAYGMTDERGQVELSLPPGQYRLVADPPRDQTYVRTYDELTVNPDGSNKTHGMELKQGCVLILEAVDAKDGSPIEGVTFWYETADARFRRTGVQSSTTYVDNPQTDSEGKLQAVVLPGRRVYGVGWNPLPGGYKINLQKSSQTVECEAGKIVRARFELSR